MEPAAAGAALVDQDAARIGERAAKLALKLLESKKPSERQTILLPPALVVRESSARKPVNKGAD